MTMLTKWGAALDRSCPLPEYPRPQLRRESFYNLNGVWDYAITASGDEPEVWDGEIVVPFSPEAPLSGAARGPAKDEFLHYRRSFTLPDGFRKDRVLLHFGAVDQIAEVFVNGVSAVKHSGGYWPFSADITSLLREGENVLCVTVRDNADDPTFAYGKQRYKRGGMWYTAQSGIWQTVWLESVPEVHIVSLRITPEFDDARVRIELETAGESRAAITCDVRGEDGSFVAGSWAKGGVCVVPLPGFHAWTPDDPYLYALDITCGEDHVESYFAMRKFSYVEHNGHKVFGLNNVPLFHNGLLDQGYYPDGLLTPPSDEAMVHDIETMKRCGFNMLRKHIKIEPLRWYYHCDRLGMIVWQDMVSGGQPYSFLHVSALPTLGVVDLPDRDAKPYGRSGMLSRARFRREMADTVRHLYNCPCIALWTVFNEGWGQFDALEMANELKMLDATRFIDHASGWQDQGREEMKSRHIYFRPVKLKNDGRALALTEYGGYVLAVDGHRWTDKVFGYRICRDAAALTRDYEKLMLGQVLPHIRAEGLTAAVYTQITDVEEELNGLMSYDREVLKIPEETLREINAALHFDA